eukprot:g5211.t1
MDQAQKISALEAQLKQGEQKLRAIDAQKKQALEHVRNEATSALTDAQARSAQLEQRLKDLNDMKLPDLNSTQKLDSNDPDDIKLLQILKHFGGDEILKVVQETEELQKKLENLKKQIATRESELKRMKDMANEAKAAVDNDIVPLEKLLERLAEKEDELRQKVVDSGKSDVLRHFLQRQQGLLEQEQELRRQVEAKEKELADVRSALCNVDMSNMTPEEKERAKLFVEWKTNLKAKHEYLREFREEQYRMLMSIKARRDTMYVVAELEKKAELDAGRKKGAEYKQQIEQAEKRIKLLEQGMLKAGTAMREFRREFEQMRVAIMLDKTIKSTQMASLEEHKKRLRRAEDLFERLVDKERQRIQEEEAEKWRPRLAAAKEKMAKQLQLQQEQMKKKIAQVREALGTRYQEGFDPLLREAEARYAEEAQASERLAQEIAQKEQLLKTAERDMRRLEAEVMTPQSGNDGSGGNVRSKEMDQLNMELRNLWVELKSDPDEVATFLSELDAISPYNDAVLKLYEAAEAQLSKMDENVVLQDEDKVGKE